MADTPDTPKTDVDKPATTRRRAPRATTTRKAPTVRKAPAAKAAAPKTVAAKLEAAPAPKPATTTKSVKPRSTKRATPRPAASKAAIKSKVGKVTEKAGGKWGIAAIAGGVAATGAALAALVTLRSSTPKPVKKPKTTDESKSDD